MHDEHDRRRRSRPSRLRRRIAARRARGERGAALVEFALVSIPLFTILFGTIEFGWAFFQLNDIRHGAREAIRLVAVDSDVTPDYTVVGWTGAQRLAQAGCERMDQRDGVSISMLVEDRDGNGVFDVGDDVTLIAEKPLDQLTKVFANVLNSVVLDETITTRLEQDPDFAGGASPSSGQRWLLSDTESGAVAGAWDCQ